MSKHWVHGYGPEIELIALGRARIQITDGTFVDEFW